MKVNIDVKVNTAKLAKEFEALKDDNVMYEIHDLFAKMCDPYVPMQEGVLAQSVQIYKDRIAYAPPYAHYMYVGEIYGPNIPVIEDGIVTGFFSIPNMKKKPTGREMSYDKEKHPLASKEWDKAMMQNKSDVFLNAVKDILMQKFKELYG